MPIVKIIDFGLCAEFKDGHTSSAFVGTMTYAAPEVRTGTGSGTRSAVQYHSSTAAFPFGSAVSQHNIIVQSNAAVACSSAVLQHEQYSRVQHYCSGSSVVAVEEYGSSTGPRLSGVLLGASIGRHLRPWYGRHKFSCVVMGPLLLLLLALLLFFRLFVGPPPIAE